MNTCLAQNTREPGKSVISYENLSALENILAENYLPADSLVYKILERNAQKWDKILLVCDWTGSMYPYGMQVLVWLKLHEAQKDKIKTFVFFNDGDQKNLGEKIIGETGGIYFIHNQSFSYILQTMAYTQNAGQGGDSPENNVEALLFGQNICPDCRDIILLADAEAIVRDISLLDQFVRNCALNQQKLHIILCGAEKNIMSDYLEMAFASKGTLHTIEQDLDNLYQLKNEEFINIKHHKFQLKEGMFWIVPKKKKKK